ncbi:MAG: RNA polymerase sigma factor [Chloroflexota bacterium]
MDKSLSFTTQTAVSDEKTAVQGIINRCLAGEDSGYVALYNMYSGMIYRLTYGLLQNREDAEEVLQDSFEYAFRSLSKYDSSKAAFKTWLYQIAVSRCRNKRRRKWLPTFSIHQLDGDIINDEKTLSPDEQLRLSDQQAEVWRALKLLNPKLRETAVLRYYHGLTFNEIGTILGIPGKTAESRMRLAHKALKKRLAGER